MAWMASPAVCTVGDAARRKRSYFGNPLPSGYPASARRRFAWSGLYGSAPASRPGSAQWNPGGSIPYAGAAMPRQTDLMRAARSMAMANARRTRRSLNAVSLLPKAIHQVW